MWGTHWDGGENVIRSLLFCCFRSFPARQMEHSDAAVVPVQVKFFSPLPIRPLTYRRKTTTWRHRKWASTERQSVLRVSHAHGSSCLVAVLWFCPLVGTP